MEKWFKFFQYFVSVLQTANKGKDKEKKLAKGFRKKYLDSLFIYK